MNIDQAFRDQRLFGAAFDDLATWQVWLTILCAAFALPLTSEQLQTFAQIAGGRLPPAQRVRELWCVAGRRSGKSRIAGLIAVFLALFGQHRLSRGERGMVLVLASSREQAKVVFDYVKSFLTDSPILQQEVENIIRGEIQLRNGITIAVHSNSFRTVRGRTLVGCVMDEVSFWRDESSATPDQEVYRAVLPSLATTNGMLVGISTPYRKLGLLHQKHRDHFGQSDDEVLVVQGATATFNPSLSEQTIATQRAADPTAATSEWDAEFRADISSFLDDALIEQAVEHGRPLELPPVKTLFGSVYKAFTDPSGGVGANSYTLAIAHKDDEQFVLDVLRGTSGKFDPNEVTKQYAALLREYGIHSVTGDSYAAQWVASAWLNTGISYVPSDIPKSQIYRECIPLFTRGLVKLPDHGTLLRELRLLERTTHRGGKEPIDHPRGGHDDYANSLCGALRQLSDHLGFRTDYAWVDGSPIGASEAQLTDEQRAARRKEEAEEFHRQKLMAYLGAHGAFGVPFGRG